MQGALAPPRPRSVCRLPRKLAWAYRTLLLAIACAIVFPAVTLASPESRDLIRQGAADLAQQRYEEALKKFAAAAQADPSDAEAVFFQGAALNRLGRSQEALPRLERAASMGSHHPDLAFEMGWALLRLRRFNEAVTQLEQYEQTRPGRGKTSEFLGRAYLGLREYAKAECKLREAMRRDPALKPTALLYLANLERERANLAAARENLEQLLREEPGSPLVRRLRTELERRAREAGVPPPGAKPWHVTVSVGAGINSNVIALGDQVPLPIDISSKRSGFARVTLNASYDWRLTSADFVTAGYGFLADAYENVPSFNLRDHFFYADYRHIFSRDLAFALRLSDEFTQIGGKDFRNQVALRPALGYRLTDWAAVEISYSFATSDYKFPSPSVQNRDGVTHTLGGTAFFTIPGTRIQPRIGYFHVRNRADGDDFDFKSNRLVAGVSAPLIWKIAGDLSWTRSFDRYDHPNSLSGTVATAFNRKDDIDIVTAQLRRPILDWLSVYARYDFVHDHSNIPFFRFSQNVFSAGIIGSW